MAENANAEYIRTPSRQAAPVLVGRTREQVFLREELAARIAGRGRLVLLGGEAGIGKTTLARDLAGRRPRAAPACSPVTATT